MLNKYVNKINKQKSTPQIVFSKDGHFISNLPPNSITSGEKAYLQDSEGFNATEILQKAPQEYKRFLLPRATSLFREIPL